VTESLRSRTKKKSFFFSFENETDMKKQPAHFALQKSKQMTVQTIKEGDVSVE